MPTGCTKAKMSNINNVIAANILRTDFLLVTEVLSLMGGFSSRVGFISECFVLFPKETNYSKVW